MYVSTPGPLVIAIGLGRDPMAMGKQFVTQRRMLRWATVVLVLLGSVETVRGGDVRDALDPPGTGQSVSAALQPLSKAIGRQVANQITTPGTSASFIWEFGPDGVPRRTALTLGPIFSERAPTVGWRRLRATVSYSLIDFTRFNGRDLDSLTSRVEIGELSDRGRGLVGLNNDTGVPTRFRVALDLEAQLVNFSFTYGVLPAFDVAVLIPVVRTFARGRIVEERTPDPRCLGVNTECDEFFAENGSVLFLERAARESALGIGDIRLRSKYFALHAPVQSAGLIELTLPTGSLQDFHGTGDTRIGTFLILSQPLLDSRLEPHVQGGVEFNVDDVDRSQARYAAGFTLQISSFLAVTLDFLGRSEFAKQSRIPRGGFPVTARLPRVEDGAFPERPDERCCNGRPFFLDVKRNDVLDLALGFKLALGRRAVLTANAIVPLNSDSIRAEVVPTVGLEWVFDSSGLLGPISVR